jgi:hypothetical protein
MAGRLINGIRYVGLMNDNSFKSKSLEDNVYFTLRDIFWNGDIDDVMTANHYNGLLTNGVSFEERNKNFKYASILYDYNSDYTKKLYNWLIRLTGYKRNSTNVNGRKDRMFEFLELEEGEVIDMSEYMKYDDWWDQLQELMKKLEEQLEKHKTWEEEDVGRDCDRLAELEDENDDDYFCEYGCGGEYDYEPCHDEILDGGPGSYPEWLNDP